MIGITARQLDRLPARRQRAAVQVPQDDGGGERQAL